MAILTATIASGQTTSNACDLSEHIETYQNKLFGLVFPSAMTGTTITPQVSFDGGTTWVGMTDSEGTALSITVTVSKFVYLDPYIFSSVPMVRLVSGSAEAAARTIGLVLRAV